jgi:hypothetical protein
MGIFARQIQLCLTSIFIIYILLHLHSNLQQHNAFWSTQRQHEVSGRRRWCRVSDGRCKSIRGVTAVRQGLKNQPIFSKITEIWRDRPGLNLKIVDFWNSNSEILKKRSGKLCKKLDQILRTLVEKFVQISTVLLDKIQIESKT